MDEALAAGVAQADVDAYLAEAAGAWEPPSRREGAKAIQEEFKALEAHLAGGGTWGQDDEAKVRELIERTKVMLRSNLRSPALHRPFTHHPRQGLPYHYGASLHGLTGMTPTDYRVGGTHDVLRRGK